LTRFCEAYCDDDTIVELITVVLYSFLNTTSLYLSVFRANTMESSPSSTSDTYPAGQ